MKHTGYLYHIGIVIIVTISIISFNVSASLFLKLDELVSNPDKYHGKHIAVYGYIDVGHPEVTQIKNHKDCSMIDSQDEIHVWLKFTPDKKSDVSSKERSKKMIENFMKYRAYDGKCGWVYGEYDKNIRGHFGVKYNGGIKNISKMALEKE